MAQQQPDLENSSADENNSSNIGVKIWFAETVLIVCAKFCSATPVACCLLIGIIRTGVGDKHDTILLYLLYIPYQWVIWVILEMLRRHCGRM